ncbi:MAG: TraR/DksA family transcriptional regulator [Phycisphaerales bacterium]|nr:TraR/DksA family transcriptional regulator [Phycisphaerales bacterium]
MRKKAAAAPRVMPDLGNSLLGPGSKPRKPLIPSGPKAAKVNTIIDEDGDGARRKKTPFNKRQLDKFRTVLLQKRAALIGDVSQLEGEALQSQEGSVTTNHIAEQGSDNYDQSLSLDLAAADRKLIKEIDDALAKIADRTYGLCELTGKPIRPERLEELPWARYSIDAARELERRSMP